METASSFPDEVSREGDPVAHPVKEKRSLCGIIAFFSLAILAAFSQVSGKTQPNAPIMLCFLVRPEPLPAFSRPDLTSAFLQLYVSKLTCGPEIIHDDKGNEFRIVDHTDRRGLGIAYVRASDVHMDVSRGGPGLDAWVASVRRHVAARDIEVAQELIKAAQKIFQDAELAEINLAIATDPLSAHTRSNYTIDTARKDVERLRKKGKKFQPPQPAPERTSAPAPGSFVYAAVPQLQLMAEPREAGAVSGFLPIGAKAEVLSIDGPWARVRSAEPAAGTDIWEVKQGIARAVTSYRPIREGYAQWASLSDNPPSAAGLLARAADFEKASRYAEAFRDLKGAAALDIPSSELGQRLRTAGIMAGKYVEAIRLSSITERTVSAENAHAVVEMQVVSRCRGDRVHAPVLDIDVLFAPFYADTDGETMFSDKAFSLLPENACLLPFGECRCEEAMPMRPEQRKLQQEFADGPWLKVQVSVPARPFPRDSRLFIFETPVYNSVCGGRGGKLPVRIFPAVPWPEPGGSRVVWVKLKSLRGFHSAIEAHDESEARKRAIEIMKKCDPDMMTTDRVRAIGGVRMDNYCGC